MKDIRGLARDMVLLSHSRTSKVRDLPLSVQWVLFRSFQNDVLTLINGKYIVNSFFPPIPSAAYERMVESTIAVYQKKPYPYSCFCSMTDRCGFQCWHCSKAMRAGEELSTQQWIGVMQSLLESGVCLIGFTGGEPLFRADLEQVIRSIGDRAAKVLFTTGEGLDENRAQSLKAAGLDYVVISLDHYDRQRHDRYRGRTGAFEIATDAIQTAVRHGFYTGAQLTANRELLNDKAMRQYLGFVTGLGAHEVRIIEPMPTGMLLGKGSGVLLSVQEHEFLRRLQIAHNRSARLPKVVTFAYLEDRSQYGCGAGIQHMYIDAYGKLCPCDFTPLSFGNVVTEGFRPAYERLRENFPRPRDACFVLTHHELIKGSFRGELPIAPEQSAQLCARCAKTGLPEFYRRLGWV